MMTRMVIVKVALIVWKTGVEQRPMPIVGTQARGEEEDLGQGPLVGMSR
jgi:hypothetical protein